MIVLLNETILWWHWVVLGIFVLIAEMNTGTFMLLGLGIAAMLVGFIDMFFYLSFTAELSVWMILSIITTAIWFKFFKVAPVTDSGQSNYRLDTLGIVIEEIQPHKRGKVIFDAPVLGNTSWPATATTIITKDTQVQIVQINGQLIEVESTPL